MRGVIAPVIVVAGAALLITPALAAPGTTEHHVQLDRARFGFASATQLTLRLDFDRAPTRLQQVQVGIHVIDPVRAIQAVQGRSFKGGLRVALRQNGERQWVAGRTYPLLVIFCAPRKPATARAAKGNCTWIRSHVLLRARY
jgi:hypothetical protein